MTAYATLRTPRLKIAYLEWNPGGARAAVLLHGWPDSPECWRPVAQRLYNIHTRFSYYFFSVYVSLSKNSLFLPSTPNFSAKADAKVRTIFHPCKYFKNFFREKQKVFAFFDNTNALYLIIYREKAKKGNRHCCQFPSFTAASPKIDVTYGNICCAPSAVARSSRSRSRASSAISASRQ